MRVRSRLQSASRPAARRASCPGSGPARDLLSPTGKHDRRQASQRPRPRDGRSRATRKECDVTGCMQASARTRPHAGWRRRAGACDQAPAIRRGRTNACEQAPSIGSISANARRCAGRRRGSHSSSCARWRWPGRCAVRARPRAPAFSRRSLQTGIRARMRRIESMPAIAHSAQTGAVVPRSWPCAGAPAATGRRATRRGPVQPGQRLLRADAEVCGRRRTELMPASARLHRQRRGLRDGRARALAMTRAPRSARRGRAQYWPM